ncbi:hypothetical protein [Streptomyces sp. VB1]|uniref:hypothetical protein n=1 Tax=Streptomyces sp. VB1 TaxID=2986803 RepID=UPI002241D73E|nr:hypothetical protein [Streptomyces sp. VB1]UZI33476.1 hypothetical protein OH133_38350 [Streptomyces sp. VB1]
MGVSQIATVVPDHVVKGCHEVIRDDRRVPVPKTAGWHGGARSHGQARQQKLFGGLVTHCGSDRFRGMTMRKAAILFMIPAAATGTVLGTAAPASAGGIGDFLSPAFGISCANQNTGAHATGSTRQGTGTAGGNLAGLPIGSALNQCGGADAPSFKAS